MMARITVGMQCFWGAEALFGSQVGVITTRVGYAGGKTKNPTYRNIGDHVESVDIEFDSKKISFDDIIKLFLKSHDPTLKHKRQYMSAIFYRNEDEKAIIEKLISIRSSELSKPVVTEVIKFDEFTNAENYHQKYFLRKHPSIIKELDLNDEKLIVSPVATKLNGICAGFGSLDLIDQNDLKKISQQNVDRLKKLLEMGPNLSECGI